MDHRKENVLKIEINKYGALPSMAKLKNFLLNRFVDLFSYFFSHKSWYSNRFEQCIYLKLESSVAIASWTILKLKSKIKV